jgi:subfamily B ATP-binding cassette protein MsbA
MNRITLLLISTFFLRSISYYFQVYILSFVGERIVTDLRSQLYSHLHDLSLRFFAERRTGELLSRISSDVTLVRAALTNNVAIVLGQSVTFLGSLILMLVLNWRLTLFILALAPAIAITPPSLAGVCAVSPRRCRTSWPIALPWLKKPCPACVWSKLSPVSLMKPDVTPRK